MDVVEDVCDRVVILSDGQVIADDSVEDLVGVFDTQAYRISVDGVVPDDVRARLDAAFRVDDWERFGDHTRFEVTLTEETTLYDVLDALRDADLALADVDGRDPNLEDVFLEVTNHSLGGDAA